MKTAHELILDKMKSRIAQLETELAEARKDIDILAADRDMHVSEKSARIALASQEQQSTQEPLITLILGGIEGDEYSENDAEWHGNAVEALQERLVHGGDAVYVSLYSRSQPAELSSNPLQLQSQTQKEPVGFIVEGRHHGKLLANRFSFGLDEAKHTASMFTKHYETVTTKAVYFALSPAPEYQDTEKDENG